MFKVNEEIEHLLVYWSETGLTPYEAMHIMSSAGRAGGTGRRTGLKILWTRVHAGSIPAPGTMKELGHRGVEQPGSSSGS